MCIKHPGSFRDVCGCFLSFTSLSFDVSQSSPLLCLPPCLSCSLPLTSSFLSLRLSCFTHLLSSAISSLWQHISVSNANPSLISGRCAIIVFHRLFLCQAALMFVLFRADLHILTGQRQYFVCLCSDFLFFFFNVSFTVFACVKCNRVTCKDLDGFCCLNVLTKDMLLYRHHSAFSPCVFVLHRNPSCEVHQEPVSLNVIDPSLHDTLPQCINTRCSQRYTSRYTH